MGSSVKEIRLLSRVLALQGIPVPGGRSLLVLSNTEHADNQEAAIKASGQWECEKLHCRDCTITRASAKKNHSLGIRSNSSSDLQLQQQNSCYSEYQLHSGVNEVPPVPRRGEPVSGVTLEIFSLESPLSDGTKKTPLYVTTPVQSPKRPRGRPRSTLTDQDRKSLREQKQVEWDTWIEEGSWDRSKLEVLKRGDLLTLGAYLGIHNPVQVGSNDALRDAIAEVLEIE